MEDETSEPARKRRRPALSCIECRRRKIKCDRNYPCDHCKRIKATCVFKDPIPALSTEPLADTGTKYFQTTDRSRHEDNASIPHSLPTPSSSNDLLIDGQGSRSTVTFIGQNSPASSDPNERTIQSREARVRHLEQGSKPTIPSERSREKKPGIFEDFLVELPENSGSHRPLRANLLKTRVLGPTHWISTFSQFATIRHVTNGADWNGATGMLTTNRGNEIKSLLQQCKNLVRIIKAQYASPWASIQDARSSISDRNLSNLLVQCYFRTFESTYRILHIPSFQKEYDRYWTNPAAASTTFVVILMLVMSIGACFYQGTEDERRHVTTLAKRWTDAAHKWLGPLKKEHLTLNGLQASCLLILARQVNSMGADLTWMSMGTLLRMAMLMGLHRDPDVFPKMSPLQAEIRRRLWATVLEISVQSSLEVGMPPMVALEDSDVQLPLNIDDDELDESTESSPPSKPPSILTQTSIQITLAKSLYTRLNIAKLTNHFFREPSYDEVLALNTKSTNATREYLAWVRGLSGGRTLRAFDRNMMLFLHRRFQLALHRPFAMKARTDPRFYYSRKMALEISLAMGAPEPDDDFERLVVLGGVPYREIVLNAAQIVCLELIAQFEDEDVINLTSPSHNTQAFQEAITRALDWSKERVKHEETNVKALIFYSMTKGQIDAMKAGLAPEPAILDAAKSSTEICLELLRARIARLDNAEIPVEPPIEQPMEVVGGEVDAFRSLDLDTLMPMNFEDPVNDWLFAPWEGYAWPSMPEL